MLPVSARFYKQHFLAPFLYADQYRHLLRFYRPFFTAFYIQAVDACSHMYWKYLFPDEFADVDTKEVSRYHDVIPRAYEVADQVIGNILSDFGESTLIVVASDHGFQGFGGDPRRIRYRLRTERLLKLLGLEEIVTYVNRGEVFTTLRVKKAHTEREPEVVKLLSEVHVPQLDKPLFLIDRNNLGDIILRQNIYVDAPESLVVQVPGQKCTFADLFVINSFRKSGIHAHDGILVMRGPGVRQNIVLPECSVLDVTPTILGLLGLPIGRDMDGKVLEAAIEPSWLELHPLRFIDSHDGDFVPVDAELDEELSAVLRDRLRALGYID
jgi:arylsulfatase A-like enzyme